MEITTSIFKKLMQFQRKSECYPLLNEVIGILKKSKDPEAQKILADIEEKLPLIKDSQESMKK